MGAKDELTADSRTNKDMETKLPYSYIGEKSNDVLNKIKNGLTVINNLIEKNKDEIEGRLDTVAMEGTRASYNDLKEEVVCINNKYKSKFGQDADSDCDDFYTLLSDMEQLTAIRYKVEHLTGISYTITVADCLERKTDGK